MPRPQSVPLPGSVNGAVAGDRRRDPGAGRGVADDIVVGELVRDRDRRGERAA